MTSTIRDHPVAAKFRDIVNEISGDLYERRELVEALVITLLARQHAVLFGDPGVAKSMAIEMVFASIDAETGVYHLDRQLPPESLFGPWDLTALDAGKWERNVEGYLPEEHFTFLDEIGKAGPAVLNQLLRWLNERKFRNGTDWIDCPLVSCFTASNEELDAELDAFDDRLLVRLLVEDIREDTNFVDMLRGGAMSANGTRVSLAELDEAHQAIPQIEIPDDILEAIAKLRRQLFKAEVPILARRWKWSMSMLRAYAFYNGRDFVAEDDLEILKHTLWRTLVQRDQVREMVISATGEASRKIIEMRKMVTEIDGEIDGAEDLSAARRGQLSADVQAKLTRLQNEANKLHEEMAREGRPLGRMEDLMDFINRVRIRVYQTCMGMSPEAAARMATS